MACMIHMHIKTQTLPLQLWSEVLIYLHDACRFVMNL